MESQFLKRNNLVIACFIGTQKEKKRCRKKLLIIRINYNNERDRYNHKSVFYFILFQFLSSIIN